MSIADMLGRSAILPIRRFGTPGAFLALDPADTSKEAATVLLLGPEIPENAKEGDELEVFVHLDSEGRPLATTRVPKLERGDVAFLTVTARTDFGAFVDWGLAKELLVPLGEQTTEMRVGERYAVAVYLDATERLAATMRVSELLGKRKGEFARDEWVNGEAWRKDDRIGLFVIVEKRFVGLVPASEPHHLSRGEAARFRVTNVLPDGKIELSLRAHAHEELATDAEKILAQLALPNAPKVGDHSSPEEIRTAFGLSKKAFKRAVGRLLKERAVLVDSAGFLVRR